MFRVSGLDFSSLMEVQMDKKMATDMETGRFIGIV